MKDLGREARTLLDAAAGANAAPSAIRQRTRKRLVAAMAAGTVTTSAVVAKGAWLVVKSASLSAAPVATSTSLTATLVSAVVIGLSTGLVAVSPTSKTEETRLVATVQAPPVRSVSAPRTVTKSVPRAVASTTTATAEFPPGEEAPSRNDVPLVVEPQRVAPASPAPHPEAPPAVAPATKASLDVAAPNSPTKASIARETELLAEVQRAIKSGQAWKALYTLDRHAEEFPKGQLYEEATASRVVALCAVGRNQDGRRWADEFLRRYPNSPLSSRVRSACAKAATVPPGVQSTNE